MPSEIAIYGYKSFGRLRTKITKITEKKGETHKKISDDKRWQILSNRTQGEKPGIFYDDADALVILRLDDIFKFVSPGRIKPDTDYQEIKNLLPSAQQHVSNILLLRKGEKAKEAAPEVGTTPVNNLPKNLTMRNIFGVKTYEQLIRLPAREQIKIFARLFRPEENEARSILSDNFDKFLGPAIGESLPVKKSFKEWWERVEAAVVHGKFIGIPVAELFALKNCVKFFK